jgi:regulator of sigma E protease
MSALHLAIQCLLLILVVIAFFNLIIFVHELGHFLAAKWRGLKVERFQIWFGTPIWKKEIGGVQYGLGWIPVGGFVALPQMAPMESIEGSNRDGEPLPPVKARDKIIVAFAGPLFSLLLALLSATVVWVAGKPKDFIPSQVVGSVEKDSPAEVAGFHVGDKILRINGKEVNGFRGTLDSIFETIILSKGEHLQFEVQRAGESQPRVLVSEFKTPPSKWFQRRNLRRVGIGPENDHVEITNVIEGGPAADVGLKPGDKIVSLDGKSFAASDAVYAYIKELGAKPIRLEYERKGVAREVTLTARVPSSPPGKGPMLGIAMDDAPRQDETIVYPKPLEQVVDSLKQMWTTITSVASPSSSIGIDHLSGPVGIAKVQFQLLQMDHPWQRLLAFLVLFNVNLAVLNMLPFPVLDGGHITLATLETLAGRPVKAKFLEALQMGCALLLISLMLYVSSKDFGDGFGRGPAEKIEFRKQ